LVQSCANAVGVARTPEIQFTGIPFGIWLVELLQ
jgi:hypothetical protein